MSASQGSGIHSAFRAQHSANIQMSEAVVEEIQALHGKILRLEVKNLLLEQQNEGLTRENKSYTVQLEGMREEGEQRDRIKRVLSGLLNIPEHLLRANPEDVVRVYETRLQQLFEEVSGSSRPGKASRTIEHCSPGHSLSQSIDREGSPFTVPPSDKRLEKDPENSLLTDVETVTVPETVTVQENIAPAAAANWVFATKLKLNELPKNQQQAVAAQIIELTAKFFRVDESVVKERPSESYTCSVHLCRTLNLEWKPVAQAFKTNLTTLCTDSRNFIKSLPLSETKNTLNKLVDFLQEQGFEHAAQLKELLPASFILAYKGST